MLIKDFLRFYAPHPLTTSLLICGNRNGTGVKKTNLKSNLFLPFWGLIGKDFGSHNLSTAGSRFMLTEKIFF